MDEREFRAMLARVLNPEPTPHVRAVGTPTYGGDYAAGGLFGGCGYDNTLINAICGPGDGIIDTIPWEGTDLETQRWDVLTDAIVSGTEATTDCQTCRTAALKVCTLNTCFGQYCGSTEEVSLLQFGMRQPGATTRRLLGGIPGLPASLTIDNRELTPAEILLVGAGYVLRSIVQPDAWAGNNATNPGPGETDMNGLELMINTGLVDAYDGHDCPGIDSDLKPFTGCIGDVGASDVVRLLTAIKRTVDHRLTAARLDPTRLKREIWMRLELWDAVAAAWPALYALMATPMAVPATAGAHQWIFEMWQEIRSRQALPIDGQWFPVRFDSGITGAYNGDATRFTSDIFFLGMQYDREPIIYGQYQDFSKTTASLMQTMFSGLLKNGTVVILDGGRYIGNVDNVRLCADATVWVKPRILVRAPWMSGRVTDVCSHILQPYCGPDYPVSFGGHEGVYPPRFYGLCDDQRPA